jgi:hypothetical protein
MQFVSFMNHDVTLTPAFQEAAVSDYCIVMTHERYIGALLT